MLPLPIPGAAQSGEPGIHTREGSEISALSTETLAFMGPGLGAERQSGNGWW
jgi:hypothetical protein